MADVETNVSTRFSVSRLLTTSGLGSAKNLDEAGAGLRALAVALRGADKLTRQFARSEAVKVLKGLDVDKAGQVVDIALDTESGVDLEDADPWENPVGAEVLDCIVDLLTDYIVFARPAHAITVALWILYTWVAEVFDVAPYLGIASPVKRCGKTNLMNLIRALSRRALAVSSISEAALFRVITSHRPTLLIDEADTLLPRNDSLRGILNSGHTRATAFVIRNVVGPEGEWVPRRFSTFGPKAIALIGRLPSTLEDRAIVIEMRRKTKTDRIERLRLSEINDWIQDILRPFCRRWADDNIKDLKSCNPSIPPCLHDRAADNWRPLLAIADRMGGRWPQDARAAAEALNGDGEDADVGVQLLTDLRSIFGHTPALSTDQILGSLNSLDERPWGEWKDGRPMTAMALAGLLKPFGVMPAGTLRFGRETAKGYRRESFADAWERYQPSHGNKPNQSGLQPLVKTRHTGGTM